MASATPSGSALIYYHNAQKIVNNFFKLFLKIFKIFYKFFIFLKKAPQPRRVFAKPTQKLNKKAEIIVKNFINTNIIFLVFSQNQLKYNQNFGFESN